VKNASWAGCNGSPGRDSMFPNILTGHFRQADTRDLGFSTGNSPVREAQVVPGTDSLPSLS